MSDSSAVPTVQALLARLEERDARIEALEARVDFLLERLEASDALNASLRTENDLLKAKIATLEVRLGKNSQNSSKPPSTDAFVKPPPRSLRRPSGRAPGKQPGDAGMRLEPAETPDQVLVHEPGACERCGLDLTEAPIYGERFRQVFDLPPLRLEVVEHRVRTRRCSCGHHTEAQFPPEATATTCYGPKLQGLAAYLLHRQHLPVARTAELMADTYGAPVSTGWLASLATRAKTLLEPFLETARQGLRHAAVVHFDETGARVDGTLSWVHVACTPTLTLLHLAPGRSAESMSAGKILGHGFNGVAIHDGLPAYRKFPGQHGLCNVHHLRELAGISEATGQAWATTLAELLVEILMAVNEAKTTGKTRLNKRALRGYRRRYQRLLDEGFKLNPLPAPTGKRGRPAQGPIRSLLKRLDTNQDDVLRFAHDFRVPFSNNEAERSIRMVKLQQKISGSWRSPDGAEAFLAIRSYVGTALKQGANTLKVLQDAYAGEPWIPATA